jgi:hypothetical protein
LHLQNKDVRYGSMLTNEDLEQIGKVIDGRLEPIKQDIQGLKDGQTRIEQRLDRVERNQAQDGEVLGEISAKLMETVEDHTARIKRLVDHTGLTHS